MMVSMLGKGQHGSCISKPCSLKGLMRLAGQRQMKMISSELSSAGWLEEEEVDSKQHAGATARGQHSGWCGVLCHVQGGV
jgi:hypothetical protein